MSLDVELMSIVVLELHEDDKVYQAFLAPDGEECRSSTYEWSVDLASHPYQSRTLRTTSPKSP